DLHTDIMPAGGDGKRKGETSSPGACPVGQMRVGIQGAAQLVMVAKIAVHPDVDLAAAEWILTDNLERGRHGAAKAQSKHSHAREQNDGNNEQVQKHVAAAGDLRQRSWPRRDRKRGLPA